VNGRTVERTTPAGRRLSISYEVTGTGRPLVLGHSFLCSGDMWGPQIEALSEVCRVVNIDTRGHGRSGRAAEAFSIYDLVDDALAVLDREGIESAIWAGLSLGGMTALRAALQHPDRVDGLILADTTAGVDTGWERFKYRAMIAAAGMVGLRPLLPRAVALLFGAETRKTNPDLVAEWRERFAAADVRSMQESLRALNRRDDLIPRLGEIAVPALVLVGADDIPQPPERSRRLAAGLPRAELVEIDGAGHLSTLEAPDRVTRAMVDFVLAIDPG
jgi:pimeloyl-ACP methyl ester carboxylesterase